MVETLNIRGRGIEVLVDLLTSQEKVSFTKHCALILQSNLSLPFLETILYHVEDLLTEIFKSKQHSEGQRLLM